MWFLHKGDLVDFLQQKQWRNYENYTNVADVVSLG